MSFNPNDNNLSPISRNNYEEYFLLYADNELSEQDRVLVEVFVLAHPDLQTELDLFLSAKLSPDHINLENKESLLAESMKLNAIDESLLLYLDNELSEKQRKEVEEKLTADKNQELQYRALLKAKLEPEQIVYPYKKELYHYGEKRRFVFSAYWMRTAAAVIILIGMGIFWVTYQPNKPDSVAKVPAGTQNQEKNTVLEAPGEAIATESKQQSVDPIIEIGGDNNGANSTPQVAKKSNKKEHNIDDKEEKPFVAKEYNNIASNIEEKKPEQGMVDLPKTISTPDNTPIITQQQTLNNKDVTPPPIASLNDQTTDALTAVYASVVEESEDDKKSKLKGFLRKATRFIERRTNISTTNENNQLLIGAVAIQL